MSGAQFKIPDNVSPERVVDFDFYNPPGVEEDVQLAWRRLRSGPDICWTPRNGGHWIATRAQDIQAMQLDYEHFSHAQMVLPPEGSVLRAIPLNLDPPEHRPYRRLLMPAFMPKEVRRIEHKVREVAAELATALAPRGECEFMGEFARVFPVVVFLGLVDLPLEDRGWLMALAEPYVRGGTREELMRAHNGLREYLNGWAEKRSCEPGDDLISLVAHAEIDGRSLPREEVLDMTELLLLGGLDTVASMLGFIARFLALNPGHRRILLAEPELVPNAVEELIRRHGVANTARLLTMDYEYKGVYFRKGDRIQLPNLLVGLDEALVRDPLVVDFRRPRGEIKHAAFGNGVHNCPGAVLARREIAVFLEEWLPRMPDFTLKPGTTPRMASGIVNAVLELQLSWDPGRSKPQ